MLGPPVLCLRVEAVARIVGTRFGCRFDRSVRFPTVDFERWRRDKLPKSVCLDLKWLLYSENEFEGGGEEGDCGDILRQRRLKELIGD